MPLRKCVAFGSIMVCLLMACSASAAETTWPWGLPISDGLYGQTIVIDEDAQTPIAQELADHLQQITGKAFEVTTQPTPKSITLALTDGPNATEQDRETLKPLGTEAYRIHSTNKDQLRICANTALGLNDGVYEYLEMLGVRWLLPTDTWTVIPKRPGISLDIDHAAEPVFNLRKFYGTGGFGPHTRYDPSRVSMGQWLQWAERIRYAGSRLTAGHAGELFNTIHRKELEANPEMLAEIDGQRQPWKPTTKPCYSNEQLIALYVNDRVAGYEKFKKMRPDDPRAFAISVEPADGGGHCECESCLAIGSVSDRVFSLVNRVAVAMQREHPEGFVSLLAYNEHAMPPAFDLEPNVYVLVVPYAFQRTGMSGDELLKAWSERVEHFGVYDYWQIPDWSHDLPGFDLALAHERFETWREMGADGMLLESTYGAGAMGPVHYVMSRLFWHPDADPYAVLDDFCDTAFDEAAPPMRRLLGRWTDEFILSGYELGTAYRDLVEADRLAESEAVRARLDDYKRYLHYIRLWHEYQQQKRGSPERHAAADRLIEHVWRIYPSRMVHSYRMTQMVTNRLESRDEVLREKWSFRNKENVLPEVSSLERDELNRLMQQGAAEYPAVDYERHKYSADLVPLFDASQRSSAEAALSTGLGRSATFHFHAAADAKHVVLRFICGMTRTTHTHDTVKVTSPTGKVVYEQDIPTDNEWRELTIPTAQPGLYEVHVLDQRSFFKIEPPAGLPFVVSESLTSTGLHTRPIYFFVPRGLKRVAIAGMSALPLKIRDGDGNEVAVKEDNLRLIDVPEGQDGRVWSLSNYKAYVPLRLVNVPDHFSFSREAMMVPAECVEDVRKE